MGFRQLIIISLFFLVNIEASAADLSTALDGLSKITFGRESKLVPGDTIDVLDSSEPLERCLSYDPDALVADTPGAIFSEVDFKFIRDFDQFENTFKYSYDVEANSSASFAEIISGSSTLKSFGKFENYVKNSSDSAMIIIDAVARHGRDIIREFTLKDEYQELVDAENFDEFRRRCGTHFVRGWNRKSQIRIVIQIKNTSRNFNLMLENTTQAGLDGSFGIADVMSGTVKTKISSAISNTMKLARKFGEVTATAEATGGLGIGTILAIVNNGDLSNPQTIENLLSAIATRANDFSYENSAPEEFILVQHPQLKNEDVEFNSANFEKLGKIYKALILVDERRSLYDKYKTRDYQLWERYFRVASEELDALRTVLVGAYRNCRAQGDCEQTIPASVDGLLLDDFFTNGRLDASCIHTYEYEDIVGGSVIDRFRYLSTVAVLWAADMKYLKAIDPQSAEVFAITPEFEFKDLGFEPERQQRLRIDSGGEEAKIFAEISRLSISPREIETESDISIDAIRKARKDLAQTTYILRYATYNGFEIEHVLGRPSMNRCPVYIPY